MGIGNYSRTKAHPHLKSFTQLSKWFKCMYFQAFALPQTSEYTAGCLVLSQGDTKMEVGGAPISSRKVLKTRSITRTGTISVTNGFEPYCTLQIQQRHSGHVMRLNINSAEGERKPGCTAVAPWFCRLQQTWWDYMVEIGRASCRERV